MRLLVCSSETPLTINYDFLFFSWLCRKSQRRSSSSYRSTASQDQAQARDAPQGDGTAAAAAVATDLQAFLELSVSHGAEGLMLKALSGVYEPGKRSDFWIKLKRDYIQG